MERWSQEGRHGTEPRGSMRATMGPEPRGSMRARLCGEARSWGQLTYVDSVLIEPCVIYDNKRSSYI
jgi:hypothetical protein